MKKMNKLYEAPKAEMIEMQMPVVLMSSGDTTGSTPGGNEGDVTYGDED